MYGWRKTREKGERFLKKRERGMGESLEVQGVTKAHLSTLNIYINTIKENT